MLVEGIRIPALLLQFGVRTSSPEQSTTTTIFGFSGLGVLNFNNKRTEGCTPYVQRWANKIKIYLKNRLQGCGPDSSGSA
jgi:hypothetical protein